MSWRDLVRCLVCLVFGLLCAGVFFACLAWCCAGDFCRRILRARNIGVLL